MGIDSEIASILDQFSESVAAGQKSSYKPPRHGSLALLVEDLIDEWVERNGGDQHDEQARRWAMAEVRSREGFWKEFIGHRTRYVNETLDTFEVGCGEHARRKEAALDLVRRYADDFQGQNLLLYGPVGTGKDHLAAAAVKRIIYITGKRARWASCEELFADLRGAMDDGALRSESDVIKALAWAPLLLLSDPLPSDSELTDFQRRAIYRVVDARYVARRPTIVTINALDGDVAELGIGVPAWDRLMHNATKVCCNWPSHRRG